MSRKFESVAVAEAHMAEIMDLCKRLPLACMAMEEKHGATWPVCGSFGHIAEGLRELAAHMVGYMPTDDDMAAQAAGITGTALESVFFPEKAEAPASVVQFEARTEIERKADQRTAANAAIKNALNKERGYALSDRDEQAASCTTPMWAKGKRTPADVRAHILAAKLPEPKGEAIRSLPLKEIAAKLRGLFAELGIKGISVTAPRYSMAHSVDVDVPRIEWESPAESEAEQQGRRDHAVAVRRKVEAIILAAYPDMDDRSDSMTDYFDNRFGVTV